ncbi:TetR/AcrR family transcriptional regulator [Streptomyces sp. Qhu-G9]|uniref:TetR/AcrR family transcriptional regulator n=1 Tax=Streptomyces sp. Qhu-G9 TaxID=3452799 RepID=UPI0022AC6891|nr:TetR/AcrR family transcriptional regulator [Streptomyces aurantiacus]WAU82534.1 TetR/AcrR family transcriptional regulator [Streptomyces aurantiacus]
MPRNALSREQIVQAAIALLDSEGVDGLSMRRLGSRLGATGAAVYWHVEGKEEILLLATDAVWRDMPLPDPEDVGWRTAATTMANDLYAMLLQHAWLVRTMPLRSPRGPARTHHDDHLLSEYKAAGFTGSEAEQATRTVLTFVLGTALDSASKAASTERAACKDGEPLASTGQDVHLNLAFGLGAILDGFQSRLPTRS